MNHDIAHCDNAQCKKKDTCVRYIAHIEAEERKLTYITYLIIEDVDNCGNYWKLKD